MNTHLNTSRVTDQVTEWVIVCFPCRIDVEGNTDSAEAGYLAGVHNDLHHASRPEAFLVPAAEYNRLPDELVGVRGYEAHLRVVRMPSLTGEGVR